jgi:protein-glutamine gamma-glutamyltransferase
VFALDMPVNYAPPLNRNANYQLISGEELDKRRAFSITSYPQYNTGAISKIEYAQARQMPDAPSQKIKELVSALQGFSASPEVFIENVLNHFRQEDFHYTLTPPLMENNPIETFLFETRHGFCSHYASAFVYLMRVAEIPARVVTGYQGGEYNAVGDFLEIRQADAHAWTEVWLENKGWVRFDPTAAIAPERIERGLDINSLSEGAAIRYAPTSDAVKGAMNWLMQAKQVWSNIDYSWQRWVINYNSASQNGFLSGFGINDIESMVTWMAGIVASMTVLLCLVLLYRRPAPVDPVLKHYRRFLKKMENAGYAKRAGEGPKAYADRIKSKLPDSAAAIQEITRLFLALNYGRSPGAEQLKQLQEQVGAFKVKNPG